MVQRPDPRVRWSWAAYLLLFSLIPAALTGIALWFPVIPRWAVWLFVGIWGTALVLALTVYVPMRYRVARYAVDLDGLTVISGVYFRNRRRMPWDGVRHMTVIAGPLERRWGFVFVSVAAAGGSLFLEGIPADEVKEWERTFLKQDDACGGMTE